MQASYLSSSACSGSNVYVTPKPPIQKMKYQHSHGFQYRGSLFRPSSAIAYQQKTLNNLSSGHESSRNTCRGTSTERANKSFKQIDLHERPRIQSAKGRLENQRKDSVNSMFSYDSHSSFHSRKEMVNNIELSTLKKTSVINLNEAVDVPDKEEELFEKRIQKLYRNEPEYDSVSKSRPSSAKDSLRFLSQTTEHDIPEKRPETTGIKPSVYGMRKGRQVNDNDPQVMEAWSLTGQDFPFKLSNVENNTLQIVPSVGRNMPTTLVPLERFLQTDVPLSVTGIDPKECLVFLSDNYSTVDLPEVPMPQEASESLPYSCVVVTPRKVVPQKYHHPFFDRPPHEPQYDCNHTTFNPQEDISFLLNPPMIKRSASEIRQEISELENLLEGIGSLESNCSFVKFQAEIKRAKALAKALIKHYPQCPEPEPTDTFGLLKFCKEHDQIMKVIHERRDICLRELANVEENL